MPRVILTMEEYVIEPLGIEHLLAVADMRGWDADVYLHKDQDFAPLIERAKEFDLVGMSIWTGAQQKSFEAADTLRGMGIPVAIGGPHATYYTDECAAHADWVAKGDSFRIWRHILDRNIIPPLGVKEIAPGVFFDEDAKAEEFPLPNLGRGIVYRRYPDLANSPIKSIMCSTGCPFHCTYCNSPHLNEMYKDQGGFKHVFRVRPIDDIIAEALYVRDNWGVKMFYFQDDIFMYDLKWGREFVRRWKREVGVPWHCQIRLELTRGKPGEERLDLFAEGGCSGVTLAIESGNAFLREHVLLRPMEHELIVEGCKQIMKNGLTLRTEQILQIPFSNLQTDLSTLALNCEINPTMAWSSILHPFGETNMGKIAKQWGFWSEDALSSIYWDRSPLLHSDTAMETVLPHIEHMRSMGRRFDSPLLHMYASPPNGNGKAGVFVEDGGLVRLPGMIKTPICQIEYLDAERNSRYCDQTSHLQPIFNWLSKVPEGHVLGAKWVNLQKEDWTFGNLGKLTEVHLCEVGYGNMAEKWKLEFAEKLGYTPEKLPEGVRDNPLYFCFFPSGPKLARAMLEKEIFSLSPEKFWHDFGGTARRHLFGYGLYKTEEGVEAPIAKR